MQNEIFRKMLRSVPDTAIKWLYEHEFDNLVSAALSLTQDLDAAREVAHEALVDVWTNHKKLGEYHRRPIKYFLIKMVRYKAVNRFRRSAQEQDIMSAFIDQLMSQQVQPVESIIIQEEIHEELENVIRTFPRRQRECLSMKYLGENSTREIAAILSISRKAVERCLCNGSKRLRKYWLTRMA